VEMVGWWSQAPFHF